MEEQSYNSTHPLGHTGPVTGSLYLFTFTLDVYRYFGSDWQYSRGLIIQHSLLCVIIYPKNIITYTNIHRTTDILHQQSTKWIILLTPFLCLHCICLHICTCSVYCLHFIIYSLLVGTAVAQWLRCSATNWKVAGSIPAGVIGIFHWHKILPIALWPWGRLSL